MTTHSGAEPALLTLQPRGDVRCVALLAHGGRNRSTAPTGAVQPSALRMYPFLLDLHRAGRRDGLATCQLRYRVRGYNDGDPVWSPDGKMIAYVGRHSGTEEDIHYVWLRTTDDQVSSRDRSVEKALEKMNKARQSGGRRAAARTAASWTGCRQTPIAT